MRLLILLLAAAPPARPTLTEAELKERSHAFCDALDRADAPAFEKAIGKGFMQFVLARTYDRAFVLRDLQARTARHAPANTRTWSDERSALAPGVATFMGESTVRYPAGPDGKVGERKRWTTLVWVWDGAEWKVEHMQMQSGGIEAERERWNETYRAGVGFSQQPNRFLTEVIKGIKPGAAVDVETGQGRNALFLAQKGWRVTGVDIADEGLKQLQQSAADAGVKVETVQADMDQWDPGADKWDLVSMIYAGGEAKHIDKLKRGVKKGGLFVIEFFSAEGVKGTGMSGFASGQPAASFKDGWTIVRDEVVEDIADWGQKPTKLVRFAAKRN